MTNHSLMRLAACGLFLALAASTSAAEPSSAPPDVPVAAAPVLEDRYPERRIVFQGGVVGLSDLTYATLPGFRPLTLDLYLPPATITKPAGGFPMIVYIHGGAWMAGHSRHSGALADFPGFLASLASRGYVVASVNYRLSGEAPFPAAARDVKAAIRWLRSRSVDYGIDKSRAVVWGGSAGGQLAGLTAVSCDAKSLAPTASSGVDGEGRPQTRDPLAVLAGESDCVQGAVTWYGVFDFATIAAQAGTRGPARPDSPPSPETAYLGCVPSICPAGVVAAASPISFVDRNDPPMLLIHGMQDRTVPWKQSEEMAQKLKQSDVPAELILIPCIDHSLIGATPEATRAATLKAVNATIDFIDRTIGPRRRR